jgi:hypothetical protein
MALSAKAEVGYWFAVDMRQCAADWTGCRFAAAMSPLPRISGLVFSLLIVIGEQPQQENNCYCIRDGRPANRNRNI